MEKHHEFGGFLGFLGKPPFFLKADLPLPGSSARGELHTLTMVKMVEGWSSRGPTAQGLLVLMARMIESDGDESS